MQRDSPALIQFQGMMGRVQLRAVAFLHTSSHTTPSTALLYRDDTVTTEVGTSPATVKLMRVKGEQPLGDRPAVEKAHPQTDAMEGCAM